MPRLGIDKGFFGDFAKLEKPVQKMVMEAFGQFEGHTYAGLHLEKLNHPKDYRIRTIRIDKFWRGVVLAQESGDTYYLLKSCRMTRRSATPPATGSR